MRYVKGWIRLCRIQPLIVLWQLTCIVDLPSGSVPCSSVCVSVWMGALWSLMAMSAGRSGVTGVPGREAEWTCGHLDIAHRQRDAVALVVYTYHLDRDVLLQLYYSARV